MYKYIKYPNARLYVCVAICVCVYICTHVCIYTHIYIYMYNVYIYSSSYHTYICI